MIVESIHKATILLVDDMRSNYLYILSLLRPHQCVVLYEGDSRNAEATAVSKRPDAILLDYDMPNIDGPEVCRRIRANAQISDTPIIFMTANTEPEHLSIAYDAGADDYILKSATEKEVTSRLARVISARFMKFKLKERLEEQASLTRILSHDINNLLTVALSGMTGINRVAGNLEPAAAKDMEKYTSRCRTALTRIQAVITNIRKLQSLEDEKAGAELVAIRLMTLLEESKSTFTEKLEEKKISIQMTCDPQVYVLAEYTSLSVSVINNILSNSIKFSNLNGVIELTVERTDQKVLVKIRDHGIGMNADLLAKVFSKTEKTSRPGTNNEKGTGFGMPIVKKYMELYGGSIRIESKSIDDDPNDHGTTTFLEFKAVEPPAPKA
jgi:two-component system sensor histidine kinase/response regulator